MRIAIIVGSSNSNGDTAKTSNEFTQFLQADIYNLQHYQFSYYDYEHKNKGDEFLPLMRKIIDHYDLLILATPVYWYSMSGIMKVFMDRLTDLITIEKDLGRQLRGKSLAVINSSNGNNLGDAFWLPFKETAEYLGMTFFGGLHTYEGKSPTLELKAFAEQIGKKWQETTIKK